MGETARDSDNSDLAEQLLRYFCEIESKECFAACLYTCYDLIRPDIALELAWRNNMLDFAMPYLIQTVREYTGRIDALDKKTLKKEEQEEKQKSASNDYVADYMPPMAGGMMTGFGHLALTGGAPPMQPQMQQQPQGFGAMQPQMQQMPQQQVPSMMMMPGQF